MSSQPVSTQFLINVSKAADNADFARTVVDFIATQAQCQQVAVLVGGNHLVASTGLSATEIDDLLVGGTSTWRSLGDEYRVTQLDPSFTLLSRVPAGLSPDTWRATETVAKLGTKNWRMQCSRRVRKSWGPISTTLTRTLLGPIDEEESLDLAVRLALEGAKADLSLLFLPGMGEAWTCEFAAPTQAFPHIGTPLTPTKVGEEALLEGAAAMDDNYGTFLADPLGQFDGYGPTCMIPLGVVGDPQGTLLLLRKIGSVPFSEDNVSLAESFAATVSLSLQLAEGKQAQSVAAMLEERDRIGRDLHDMGVQLLFATGMQLDRLRGEVEDGNYSNRRVAKEIQSAMGNLEDAVRQIRQVVSGLKDSENRQTFAEILESEASRARQILGFAPSLILDLDGKPLDSGDSQWEQRVAEFDSRVEDGVAADANATIREALTNVVKHAGARSVKIEVAVNGKAPVGELVVSVIDDGRGINLSRSRSSGIANMGNRAALRGGSFAVGLGPRGRGTSVVWRVPLTAQGS